MSRKLLNHKKIVDDGKGHNIMGAKASFAVRNWIGNIKRSDSSFGYKPLDMEAADQQISVKPISFLHSSIFFLTGALLFLFSERVLIPYLHGKGVPPVISFLIMATPHILFFATALYGYAREGHPFEWKAFRTRFRLFGIKRKMILWVILFVAIDILLYLLVYELAYPVLKWVHDAFPTPEAINEILGERPMFAGHDLTGNWWLLGVYFFYYFFNVFGEEFLWRGYLFPRQELQHGSNTWWIHGLQWTAFHLFAPYNALLVLPGALFMSYIVQRYRNNTIFLVAHAVMNGIPVVMIIKSILGA